MAAIIHNAKSCCLGAASVWSSKCIDGKLPLFSSTERCVVFNKWLSLVVGCFGMAIAASGATFPVWQNAMRAILNQSETESNIVYNMAIAGSVIAFPAGMIYESYGCQADAAIGAIMACAGYLFLWLGTSYWKYFYASNQWVVYIIYFFVGFASIFTYMAALMPNIDNFAPEQRGKVIGLLSGSLSVGPDILSAIYNTLFTNGHIEVGEEGKQNLPDYFLLLAVAYFAVSCALYLFTGRVKMPEMTPSSLSDNVAGEMATFPAHQTPPESSKSQEIVDEDNRNNDSSSMAESKSTAKFSDSQIDMEPTNLAPSWSDQAVYAENVTAKQEINPQLTEVKERTNSDGTGPHSKFSEFPFSEMPIKQAVRRWNFHFLMIQFTLATCVQSTYQTNISTYLRSFNMMEHNLLFTILNTSLQAISKLGAGIISDLIARHGRLPVAVIFMPPYMLQTLMLAISAFCGDNFVVMVITNIIVGVGYGVAWCQTPTLIGELFGYKHLASNWGWANLLTGVLGFPFSIGFSAIYEASIKQPGDIYCYGLECFTWSFALFAGASFCTIIMAFGLTQNMFSNAEDRRLNQMQSQRN